MVESINFPPIFSVSLQSYTILADLQKIALKTAWFFHFKELEANSSVYA